MANDLIQPVELDGFPGAPFSQAATDAAAGRLRDLAGWHIAPPATETLTVDGSCTTQLVLPSLNVTEITEIRDVTNPDNPTVLTGWRMSRAGVVTRPYGWPHGDDSIEVDLTHGFDETPPALFALAAALANAAVTDTGAATEETAGPFGVKRSDPVEVQKLLEAEMSALDKYIVTTGF